MDNEDKKIMSRKKKQRRKQRGTDLWVFEYKRKLREQKEKKHNYDKGGNWKNKQTIFAVDFIDC